MKHKLLSQSEKWMVIAIPVLFIFGSLLHFLYELSGKNAVVGAFAAVNESVWEHCKMGLLPVLLWWGVSYIFCRRRYSVSKNKWFTGALAALVTSLCSIPLLFYFYTQAFGVELLWVDILLLLIAVTLGQLMGLHVYRHGKGMPAAMALFLCFLILVSFAAFTFYPPHLPIFRDSLSGGYGIPSR